ncbi:MAG: HNH endonuclease [Fimbriimonadaceae bacterium]|nr:HNH endonuclease [Fimbriimonadaceae bacterium]
MNRHDVLLLNANYEPLNVCDCRRAISLLSSGKADLVHEKEAPIRTAAGLHPAPSVVRMRYQVRRPLPTLRLSRHSILARDGYCCQYCGSTRDLTIDHVVPRWMGGPHTWENLVACCRRCNLKKGDKTPRQANMKLKTEPRRPKFIPYLSLQQYIRAIQIDDWSLYLPVFSGFRPELRAEEAC